MAGPKSATRIGEAERTAAQRALQEHLSAGRLQITEYTERDAAAAAAVTAPELAALFTDLPKPHPKLPGGSRGATPRNVAIIGAVVVMLVGLIVFALGRQDGPTADSAAVATPTLSPPSAIEPSVPSSVPTLDTSSAASPTASADESAGGSAAALPDGGVVRRRTSGAEAITLRPNYGVDLDDSTSPNWKVGVGCCGRDVGFAYDTSRLYISNDYAVVTGPPQYATCSHETGYTNGALERGSLHAGETLCVRTSESRYAFVTVVGVSDQAFQFQATVWDS